MTVQSPPARVTSKHVWWRIENLAINYFNWKKREIILMVVSFNLLLSSSFWLSVLGLMKWNDLSVLQTLIPGAFLYYIPTAIQWPLLLTPFNPHKQSCDSYCLQVIKLRLREVKSSHRSKFSALLMPTLPSSSLFILATVL